MSPVGVRFLSREAWANTRAFPARSIIAGVVAFAVGAGTLAFTFFDVGSVVNAFESQQRRGVDTLSITSPEPLGLSAEQCDATQSFSGVTAAGGILRSRTVSAAQTPGTSVTVHTVTPGYVEAVFPSDPAVWASPTVAASQIAKELGLVGGSLVSLTGAEELGESLMVEATALREGRVDGRNRDIFVTAAPTGLVSECLVVALAGQGQKVSQGLSGWFSAADIRIQPLLMQSQLEINPEASLANRWSLWGWLFGGAVLLLLSAITWWSRRGDMALYKFLGFDARALLTMVTVETLVTVVAPAQFGAAMVIALLAIGADEVTMTAVTFDGLRLLSLLMLAIPVGYMVSRPRAVIDTLKGR